MKKLLALLLVFAALLSFAACSKDGSDVPEGYKLASDSEACAYSLYIPEAWVMGNDGTNMTTASLPGGKEEKCNISFAPVPMEEWGEGMDVPTFWQSQIPQYKALFGESFVIVDQPSPTEPNAAIGSFKAFRYVYTVTYNGANYKIMQVLAPVSPNEVYIFTYTATADHYDTHLEAVNSILSYIKF